MKILPVQMEKKKKFEVVLFCFVILLLVIGLIFVYSASYYSAEITYGNKFYFLKKQFFGIIAGFIGLIFFTFFDYHKLAKIKFWLVAVSAILLALVFVPGIGVTTYGATRWINLKFTTIQPSEFAKLAFIIFASSELAGKSEKIKSFKGLIPTLVFGILFCILIILEPNMSITITMALLVVVMLFVGGMTFKHFALLAVPAILIAIGLVIVEPYRLKRLIAFIDPFASRQSEGFQLVQSLFGIALGGIFGAGIFKSRQKYLFLPFSESDFIFSIIAEETGFVGSCVVILIFLLLIFRIFKVAKNAKDKFGFLLSVGIGALIAIQVLINLAVVTGSIPPTGLPLPFISAGSTSLVVFMSSIGVVLNINKQSKSRV